MKRILLTATILCAILCTSLPVLSQSGGDDFMGFADELNAIRETQDPQKQLLAMDSYLDKYPESVARQWGLNLMWKLQLAQSPEQAETWLAQSLESEKNDRAIGALCTQYLEYLLGNERRDEAEKFAKKIAKMKGGNAAALLNCSRLLIKADLVLPQAAKIADRAAKRDEISDFGGYVKWGCLEAAGYCYLQMGELKKAKDRLEKCLEYSGEFDDAYFDLLFQVYEGLGEKENLAEAKKFQTFYQEQQKKDQ